MTDIPTTTTQGEALEARARIANAITDHEGGAIPDHVPVLIDAGDLRAITAALQPNIAHAVGGVDRETLIRAMYEAWPHTVILQALHELTGLPYGATISFDMAQRCGASFVALERYADGILALSAPQQPVKLDAVREAGRAALRTKVEGIIRDWQRGLPSPRALVDSVMLAIPALATPPLDNTGLDPATVEDQALEKLEMRFRSLANLASATLECNADDVRKLVETAGYIARYRKEERR